MKLNIEIDSGSFEKVIADGIKALSEEELREIIKQVIYEAFTKCDDFKNLLTIRERIRWSDTLELRLGPLAQEAVKSLDMEKELAPFKEKMVKCLMENHQQIVEDMMFRSMLDSLFRDNQFMQHMEWAVQRVLSQNANQSN